MSLCRFGPDSDMYIYESVFGKIECCACKLGGSLPDDFMEGESFDTYSELHDHLLRHAAAGHKIRLGLIEMVLEVSNSPDNDYHAQWQAEQDHYNKITAVDDATKSAITKRDVGSLMSLGWTPGSQLPDNDDLVVAISSEGDVVTAKRSFRGGWYIICPDGGWPDKVMAWKPVPV